MSKVKITGNVLSIQLGRDETRIALVGKGSEILHTVCVATPEGAVEDGMIQNADAVRSMLTTALAVPEFKKCRQAVFSLCTSQVITETATVPDMAPAKLEKVLQANVDTYFEVDMREYRLAWQTVSTGKNELGTAQAKVRLWAVPTAMISRYYAVANACGLSVVAIDYCGNSIASAVGASFACPGKTAEKSKKKLNLNAEISFGKKKEAEIPAEEEEDFRFAPMTDLHLTLDNDMIGMTFVQNAQVVFQRFILCGSDPAEQLNELAMMVEYFRSMDAGRGSEIRGILSGSLVHDRSLAEGLEDMLGISLTTFSVPYDQKWLLCVGAAKTGLDFGDASLNAPGKGVSQGNSTLWQYVLVLVGGIALVLVIMTTLSSRLLWNSQVQTLQNNVQALTLEAQKTAGFADNYKNYANTYDRYSDDWDTVFASLRTYNDNLVLVLDEIGAIIPENASVTDMIIAANGLQVEFACETKEEAAYLIMALRDLTYADVIMIDNLRGGGSGAATSYGPDGEDAPTEGDYTRTSGQDALGDFIASELTTDELAELAMTLTPEQIDLLEKTYGKPAAPKNNSLTALKASNAKAAEFKVREESLRVMLTTNPLAMETFVTLVEEDFYAPQPILWNYILMDLVDKMESGAFGDGSVSDPEVMMSYMDVLLDVLTKDEQTLSAVEQLICEDKDLEKWYIYYLETHKSVNITSAQPMPFLNVEQVVEDVMDGGFNTGDADLDKKLDAMISNDTWTMINKLQTPEGVSEILNQYMSTGSTGNTAIDAMIDSYLTTGTTGNSEVDKVIQDVISSGKIDSLMGTMLNNYLTTGSTGLTAVDDMINKYLATGTTGNANMDKVISDYISSGAMDEVMMELMNLYLTTGSTGIGALDLMIEQYMATGSTGNPKLDAIVEANLKKFFTDAKVSALISKYMTTGTTGVPAIDDMIERYMSTGTTGSKWLDDLIKKYMDSMIPDIPGVDDETPVIGDYTMDDLMDLLSQYLTNGTTGNLLLDMMLEQFLANGTTGNDQWDTVIKDYIDSGKLDKDMQEAIKDYDKNGTTGSAALDKLLNNYKNNGYSGNALFDKLIKKFADLFKDDTMTDDEFDKILEQLQNMNKPNGGNTGNPGVIEDTRIFFSVVLAYNDELKNAELERKGLYYDDKLTKLEVLE